MISAYSPPDGCKAYCVAFSVAVAQLIVMGSFSIWPLLLTDLKKSSSFQGATTTTLSLAQSICQALVPVFGVVAGAASDRLGAPVAIAFSGVSLFLAFVATSAAQTVVEVVVSWAVLFALSLGALTAPGPTVLGSWFSQDKAAFGISLGEVGVALGTSLLPMVAALLLTIADDWRQVLRWMTPFPAFVVLLSFFTVQRKEPPSPEQQSSAVRTMDDNDDITAAAAAAAAGGDGGGASGISSAVKSGPFVLIAVTQFLFGFAFFGVMFIIAPFAREALGLSASSAASLYTAFGIAGALGAFLLGSFSAGSGVSTQTVVAASDVAGAVGVSLLVVAAAEPDSGSSWTRHHAFLLASSAFVGFACSGNLLGLPALVVEDFVEEHEPHLNTLMSLSFAAFGLGGAIAPPVLSLPTEGSPGGYVISFGVICGFFLIAGVLNLVWKPRRQQQMQQEEAKTETTPLFVQEQ